MAYTGIKEVRLTNGQKFIDDFKSCKIMCKFSWMREYAPFNKSILWKLSKHSKINYFIVSTGIGYRKRLIIY